MKIDYETRQDASRKKQRAVVFKIRKTAGHGLLKTHEGEKIYFDRQSVANHNFDHLIAGDEVTFDAESGKHGRQALMVNFE